MVLGVSEVPPAIPPLYAPSPGLRPLRLLRASRELLLLLALGSEASVTCLSIMMQPEVTWTPAFVSPCFCVFKEGWDPYPGARVKAKSPCGGRRWSRDQGSFLALPFNAA